MGKTKDHLVQLVITKEYWERLRKAANREHMTMAAWVRRLMCMELDRIEQTRW